MTGRAVTGTHRLDLDLVFIELVKQLSPMLGRERSETLVSSTAQELGFERKGLTAEQATAVLEHLSVADGIVGITARFELSRLAANAASPVTVGTAPAGRAPADPITSSPESARNVPLADLAALLAPALGNEKALELVTQATRNFAVVGGGISPGQAYAVLEELARAPGLVGVTARFAKARFALRTS